MLVSMSEIVFKMIALGLQYIVVLVFNSPACAPVSHNGFDGCFGDFKIGGESVLVDQFASIFAGEGQFAPVDLQCRLVSTQSKLVGIAIGADFSVASKPFSYNFRPSNSLSSQKINGFVQVGMRIRLADQNEM